MPADVHGIVADRDAEDGVEMARYPSGLKVRSARRGEPNCRIACWRTIAAARYDYHVAAIGRDRESTHPQRAAKPAEFVVVEVGRPVRERRRRGRDVEPSNSGSVLAVDETRGVGRPEL